MEVGLSVHSSGKLIVALPAEAAKAAGYRRNSTRAHIYRHKSDMVVQFQRGATDELPVSSHKTVVAGDKILIPASARKVLGRKAPRVPMFTVEAERAPVGKGVVVPNIVGTVGAAGRKAR